MQLYDEWVPEIRKAISEYQCHVLYVVILLKDRFKMEGSTIESRAFTHYANVSNYLATNIAYRRMVFLVACNDALQTGTAYQIGALDHFCQPTTIAQETSCHVKHALSSPLYMQFRDGEEPLHSDSGIVAALYSGASVSIPSFGIYMHLPEFTVISQRERIRTNIPAFKWVKLYDGQLFIDYNYPTIDDMALALTDFPNCYDKNTHIIEEPCDMVVQYVANVFVFTLTKQ